MFDPDDRAADPLTAGPYLNLGVVVDHDGYWAADPDSNGATATWRRYDWSGRATSTPAVELRDFLSAEGPALPFAEFDGELVALSMPTTGLLMSRDGEMVALGRGLPAAIGPDGFVYANGASLGHYEVATGNPVVLTDDDSRLTLAQTFGAGDINPAGTTAAVLLADADRANSAATLVVARLDGSEQARRLTLPAPKASRAEWLDNDTIVVSGSARVRVVEINTNTNTNTAAVVPTIPPRLEIHLLGSD